MQKIDFYFHLPDMKYKVGEAGASFQRGKLANRPYLKNGSTEGRERSSGFKKYICITKKFFRAPTVVIESVLQFK